MPAKHLLIHGKVQGVFYRATAKKIANELGVTGWVKNTAGGQVEAVVCGTDEQVAAFIAWCRKGPSNAVVTALDIKDAADENAAQFSIIRH